MFVQYQPVAMTDFGYHAYIHIKACVFWNNIASFSDVHIRWGPMYFIIDFMGGGIVCQNWLSRLEQSMTKYFVDTKRTILEINLALAWRINSLKSYQCEYGNVSGSAAHLYHATLRQHMKHINILCTTIHRGRVTQKGPSYCISSLW